MATKEQNDQIILMRVQIQGMLDALNQLAREVGADPIPMPIIPPSPSYVPPFPREYEGLVELRQSQK